MKKLTAPATWPRKSLNGNVNVAAKAVEEEVNKAFEKLNINFEVKCTHKTDGEVGIQFDFIEKEKKASPAPAKKPAPVVKPTFQTKKYKPKKNPYNKE